ncbi:winged helix DNA-binding domain-containing protein [Heliocybe sulcata]|uniref:Winged helix DNA-binding domain-containing protein n=1 Tax=Heliocybe sulcata TaxID=5364 RepID=A0A5C3MYQ2_9AGAM|nr:winged helix DNA-binding domain-containing protein [Heliocybe sulcata]
MLEDQSFAHIVSWGPAGDCFVVKDMNEFTKSVLPRLFKHSNFASFVRQLNKYDFHKVGSDYLTAWIASQQAIIR